MALHNKKIIFSSFFLLLLPPIFFGFPDYYGDDYHFVNIESKESFYLQSLTIWIDNYGISYRPAGILINIFLYKIFSWNLVIFYFFSVIAYLTLAYRAYTLSLKISDHQLDLSIFIFIFFIFFPFNSSVYYQLISMYMVVTYIGLFYFLEKFIDYYEPSFGKNIIFSLCWLILLFSYESLIGISVILPILYFFKIRNSNEIFLLKKHLYVILTIGIPTVIFLFLYISNPLNTKINNLSETISLEKSIISIEDTKEGEVTIEKVNKFKSNKVEEFFNKSKKSFSFFLKSISYFFDFSKSNYFFLILYLFVILHIVINIFKFKINTTTSNTSLLYILFGFLWTVGSIAPFLLYPGFVIPVYHLLLPSFGLAFLLYGITTLIFGNKKLFFIKSLFILLLFFFPIIHISYFFGLKEELNFLNNVSSKINIYSSELKTNENLILINIPDKKNNHIFWFENALSKRYLKYKINYDGIGKFKVKNSDSIHFIDKQKTDIIKVNFFEHTDNYQYFDYFDGKTHN